MKCSNCNKKYHDDKTAITIGECKICQFCVDNASSKPSNVLVNDVLAYINTYRAGCSRRKLRDVCSSYYTDEEIFSAKTILHSENPTIFGELIKRQDSKEGSKEQRSKEEANVDDIYEWFKKLDEYNIEYIIYSSNIKRLPKFNPEETDNASILERLIQVEEMLKYNKASHFSLVTRTCKLEEKLYQGDECIENIVKKTDDKVVQMFNNVKNIDMEVKTQNTVIQKTIESQVKSYVNAVKTTPVTSNRNSSNVLQNNSNGSSSNNINGNSQNISNDGWKRVQNRRKAVCGTARPGAVGTKVMGAPPPSRHFVIERVLGGITSEDLKAHISFKNSEIEIRSLECMSHSEARYKKFKLEISVEDCQAIYNPDFWQWGMRIRPYVRKRSTEENAPFFRPWGVENN